MKAPGSAWDGEWLRAPHAAPDKRARVRRMFDAIAPRYRLVNALFSGGRDAAWRRRAVAAAEVRGDDDVLDVACGTGDLARVFLRAGPRSVMGCDFSHRMLCEAVAGTDARSTAGAEALSGAGTEALSGAGAEARRTPGYAGSGGGIQWCEADALRLPFASGRFSIVSCAFGVRNFQDLGAGLREMRRVIRPGGRCVILEFTRPAGRATRSIYEFYTGRVMPVLASWISGDRTGAYRYLPQSVVSFVGPEAMCDMLRDAGFDDARAIPLTMGAVTIYLARRNAP